MPAIFIIVLAYYITGKLGLQLAIPPGVATSVWPPSAISLAALLLGGVRLWPGIFFGSLVLNVETLWLRQSTLSFLFCVGLAACYALGSTLQAYAGARLVQKWIGPHPFHRSLHVLQFACIETVVCLIAASVGVVATYFAGLVDFTAVMGNWRTWWLGDLVGVALFAPPILLSFNQPKIADWTQIKKLEVAGIFFSLIFCCILVFDARWGLGHRKLPLDFLLGLPLLWAGLRLLPFGASICVLMVSAFALAGTHTGIGPFARENISESILFAQAFAGVCSVSVLALSALLLERHRAEKAVHTGMKNLAALNKDLQTFTYGVSHDLKEPVRTITTQMQFLVRKHGSLLNEEAHQSIAYVIESAQRMYLLIDDLLSYGRTEATQFRRSPTDLNEVFQKAQTDLRSAIEASGAEIFLSPLPQVGGDESQLTRLLQNLLANAIKFRGKESPKIYVSATKRSADWVIEIRDNGIGFSMEDAHKLFEPFNRLHNRQEYPGSGLGLSVCRKIVERHGGKISARSAPGEGATFSFTLPIE